MTLTTEQQRLQTLDSLRGSVTTALSTETVNGKLPTGGATLTLGSGTLSGATGVDADFVTAVSTELSNDGVLTAAMKSKSGQSGTVTIDIAADGRVTVSVKDADGGVVEAARSKVNLEVK